MQVEEALLALGQSLTTSGYQFVTPTPASHGRVLSRFSGPTAAGSPMALLRDVFGWSRAFRPEQLPGEMRDLLAASEGLEHLPDGSARSRFRFSTLDGRLYVHSAFPTQSADAVFLGPDTYRFVRFLHAHLRAQVGRVVDIGAGSGAGGLSLAHRARALVLTDINPLALRCCGVNAALHGVDAHVVQSDLFAQVEGEIDLAVMNPPYLVDAAARAYRDGGGPHGTSLAVRFVQEALRRVAPGGQIILYTGAPIRDGRDLLREALEPLLGELPSSPLYEEIDVDVFGEELDGPAYGDIDRIAAVGLVIQLPDAGAQPYVGRQDGTPLPG